MLIVFKMLFAFIGLSVVANAQDLSQFSFDEIDGLSDVKSIAFDSGADTLFVTLEDKTYHFAMFPLRLKSVLRHEFKPRKPTKNEPDLKPNSDAFKASSNGVGPEGNLFIVGEVDATFKSKRSAPYGVYQTYRNVRKDGLDGLSEKDLNDGVLVTAPLSAVSFDKVGNVYFESTSHHSVVSYPRRALLDYGEVGGAISSKVIALACGPTANFSVGNFGEELHFVSTVSSGDVLELGNIPRKGDGLCIEGDQLVQQATKSISKRLGFSAKDHSLIVNSDVDTNQDDGNGILIFDPITNQLSFFPIANYGSEIGLRRSERVVEDLSEYFGGVQNQFGRLAADDTADAILLAGFDETEVHRLSWDGSGFSYLGKFEMDASVKNIFMSENGEYAAIVTGAPNGTADENSENEITLLRKPSSIPKGTPIGDARYSVASLQQEFRNSGDKEVEVDGILGPQTLNAIEKYKNESEPARSASASSLDKDDLIRGILPNWPAQTGEN